MQNAKCKMQNAESWRKSHRKCVMIVAGEASGDDHGARLVRAMQALNPDLFFCGIGGDSLRKAGVRIIVDAHDLSVVGLTEVFARLPHIFQGMAKAKNILRTLRPDLLILIDFPDFNLHLAATAKRLGVPVLYYISPQIWAWRPGRVKKIGQRVDHIAVILPFEEKFYRKHGIPVTYVGHPLLDQIKKENTKRKMQNAKCKMQNSAFSLLPSAFCIGLLPGSRNREVTRHLPLMLEAAEKIKAQRPDTDFLVSLAPSVKASHLKAVCSIDIPVVPGGATAAFRQCDLVIAASGTVTLEAALYGVPPVIIYQVSPLSYWLGRALIRVKHISLVNLISSKTVVPELIQGQATPQNIANATLELMDDPQRFHRLKNDLANIRHRIASAGEGGAAGQVARIALEML